MLFLLMCVYWNIDIINCFKEVLKDLNVNLTMEQIKLQCLCSVEPKDVRGTSETKTKLRNLLRVNVDI